jgi:hypothetical protein
MSIDTGALGQQMLAAALPILKTHAIDAEGFGLRGIQKIAETIASIQQMLLVGQINQQQAELLFDMQKSASRAASCSP